MENYFIEPQFEIDEKGRVICQRHTNYAWFIMPNKTTHQEKEMETLLTCKTCSHYKDDDCYFPTETIDKIEVDRVKAKKYSCKLCGNRIDRMLTVIYKLYFEGKYKIHMPLICCGCYASLENNNFIHSAKKRAYTYLYFFLSAFYLPIFYILVFLNPALLLLNILLIALTVVLNYRYLKKLAHTIKGMKYYKKYLRNNRISSEKTTFD